MDGGGDIYISLFRALNYELIEVQAPLRAQRLMMNNGICEFSDLAAPVCQSTHTGAKTSHAVTEVRDTCTVFDFPHHANLHAPTCFVISLTTFLKSLLG